MPGLPGGLVVD